MQMSVRLVHTAPRAALSRPPAPRAPTAPPTGSHRRPSASTAQLASSATLLVQTHTLSHTLHNLHTYYIWRILNMWLNMKYFHSKSWVFLTLFLLKYQRISMSWYFKRNKDRNTSENVPYLITSFIFNLLSIKTNALFWELLNISVK